MSFDRFETFNFDPKNPGKKPTLAPAQSVDSQMAQKLYFAMLRLRRCEERLIAEYHPADEMRCPVHFCVGQEAVPAALSTLLGKDDYLFSHHRSHGYYLAKVPTMDGLFAELYGKAAGASGGKAGSQDISMAECKFFSGAILAGAVPIAAGAAFALRGSGKCAVTGAGDGALDEGVYWEALSYASLMKLPLVFVCENNGYSTFSPQKKRSPTSNIAERVAALGIKTKTLFGNDVLQVYSDLKEAIAHARAGKGPVFLETFTYRWNGHVGPENDDVNLYRPAEELAYWKSLCPIALLEQRVGDSPKKEMLSRIEAEIEGAFKKAKAAPFPKPGSWEESNFSHQSPAADKLLVEERSLDFDQHQRELIPGPY